jgi:hypothetical protein
MVLYQNTKEFGILELPGYIKMGNKNIDIKFKSEFSSEEYIMPIYKAPSLNGNKTDSFVESFFSNINTTDIDLKVDLYGDFTHYWLETDNNKMSLWIKLLDGSYKYTNFSKPRGIGCTNMDEKTLLEKLGYFNIKIPVETKFSSYNGNTHMLEIDKHIYEDLLTDGQLICKYYDDGTIQSIII